jgi:hypothetical protein
VAAASIAVAQSPMNLFRLTILEVEAPVELLVALLPLFLKSRGTNHPICANRC